MRNLTLILLFTLIISSVVHATGIATIKGKIRAYKEYPLKSNKDEVSVTSFDPYISTYKAPIDKEGNFTLSFPKGFTGDVEFKFADNTPIQVIVSPGDQQYYLVEPIAKNTMVSFTGDNAATNQQISEYAKARASIRIANGGQEKPFNMIHRGILEIIEYPETFERKKAFLETYIKEQKVSPLFILWARTDVRYNYAARLFHVMSNQHQPISDPAFFKQFPMDDPESLVASSYLTYLYVVRSSAIYNSPQINTIIVYPDNPVRTRFYNQLNKNQRITFDAMLEYSNLSDSAIMANMKYPDSITRYTMTKEDRFTVNYINRNTSGLVRDFFFANYILDELKRGSPRTPKTYRFPMLMAAYKKAVPGRGYTKILKEAFRLLQ